MSKELKHSNNLFQIGLALFIMFIAGYIIPTWSTVTRLGVQYLCIMVGWIYLSIVTSGLLLPSVLALTACVIPGYYTATSIVMTTLGNSITLMMIFIFILVYIFQKTRTGEFLVRYLLSRKMINGHPYVLIAFFFLSIIIVGSIIGSFGIILLAIAILEAIADVSGMDRKDDSIRFLLLSTVALSGTTEVFFPFKPFSALYMQIFDSQLNNIGTSTNETTWLLTQLIIAVISFIALMITARFIFNFNLSKIKCLDVSILQTSEFKKMTKKQKIVLFSIIVTFFYPFLIMLIPHDTSVYSFFNNIGQNLFMGGVICLLCLFPIDGEPIADINEIFKNGTNWQIIFAVGSVIAIGGAMAAKECGVATWLLSIFNGTFGNMNITLIVIIICLLSCIITQFFSNAATAIILLTALAPMAVILFQEGVNVSVFPALIGTGTLTACLLPSGSGQSAIMLGTDIFKDDGQKWALSKGVVILCSITIAIIISGILSIHIL